jgi:hypothetical protein
MAAGCSRYREMQGCRVLMNNPEAASVGGLISSWRPATLSNEHHNDHVDHDSCPHREI